MARSETASARERVLWHLRFIGHAFLQRDLDDPRVQSLVTEKLRRDGVIA